MPKIFGVRGEENPITPGALRTCIGCKQSDARQKLLRLVRSSNEFGELNALIDMRRRRPGRGAWLHPSENCIKLALKRRAIGRALPGITNGSDIEKELVDSYRQIFESLRTDIVPL